jgi:MoaA/NifB/PqqE/SkfB family radical SAM enzyme
MEKNRLKKIVSLALEVTSYCNLKCPQCGRTSINGTFNDEYLHLKHWQIDKILPNFEIDNLTNLRYVRIEGDNGDAIMHPHIIKIIDYFYNAPSRPNIVVFTNGSIRSSEWWSNLGKKYTDRLVVQFSIDGLADTNYLYRIGSNYNKIIENAKAFMQNGGIATTRSIIFKHNEHQVEEIYNTAKSIGFKQLIMIINDQSRFYTGKFYEVYDNHVKMYDLYPTDLKQNDLNRYCYNDHQIKLYPNFSDTDSEFLCPTVAMGELTVTYLGHIIPCCMVNSDYDFKAPQNDFWREIVGNRNDANLHLHKLSNILTDSNFYHNRLEETLRNGIMHYRCSEICINEINNVKKL